MRRVLVVIGVVLAVALIPGGIVGVAVVMKKKRQGFMETIANEVTRQLEELRPDLSDQARAAAGRIVAAQGALESGWGSTRQWREGFNFANISKGSWTGPTIGGGDLEYDASGKAKSITQQWRKYSSLAEAVSDFITLLSWSRYQPARTALFAGDAALYAQKLRDGGYYTAPVEQYQAGLAAALSAADRVAA